MFLSAHGSIEDTASSRNSCLGLALVRHALTFHLTGSGPIRGQGPKPRTRAKADTKESRVRKSVERIPGTYIGVRVSHEHYFDIRRRKKKRWVCGSAARAMLAQLHVQLKTRRRSTFEAERPLIHPSTASPVRQPQAQRVGASQRCASTVSVRLIRTGSPSTCCAKVIVLRAVPLTTLRR